MRVIELSGPPRSGKTTLARRIAASHPNGERVSIVSDREIAPSINVPYDSWLWQVEYARCLYSRVIQARQVGVELLILDRGFHDMEAWIACSQNDDADLAERAIDEYARLCGGYDVELVIIDGLTAEECQRRHAASGVHDLIDDIVMGNKVLLKDLCRYYARTKRDIRLDGRLSPEDLYNQYRERIGA